MVHKFEMQSLAFDDLYWKISDKIPFRIDGVLDHRRFDAFGADPQDRVRIGFSHSENSDVFPHQLFGPDEIDSENSGRVRTLELLVGHAVSQRQSKLVGKNLKQKILFKKKSFFLLINKFVSRFSTELTFCQPSFVWS